MGRTCDAASDRGRMEKGLAWWRTRFAKRRSGVVCSRALCPAREPEPAEPGRTSDGVREHRAGQASETSERSDRISCARLNWPRVASSRRQSPEGRRNARAGSCCSDPVRVLRSSIPSSTGIRLHSIASHHPAARASSPSLFTSLCPIQCGAVPASPESMSHPASSLSLLSLDTPRPGWRVNGVLAQRHLSTAVGHTCDRIDALG